MYGNGIWANVTFDEIASSAVISGKFSWCLCPILSPASNVNRLRALSCAITVSTRILEETMSEDKKLRLMPLFRQ